MELNYHHLRYFHVVAHEQNLTRAAQRLNVAQSALSAQIRQLEARLGEPLFDRRGRGLHLTEAGRIALAHADAIFAEGEELVATLRRRELPRRQIRIGALATLSRNFQLAFLRPVLGMPDIEVILRSGSAEELFADLAAMRLDMVLTNRTPEPGSEGELRLHRIAEQEVSLIGVSGLAAPGEKATSILSDRPLVIPGRSSGIRAQFEALVMRMSITPRIVAEIDDMAMMRLLAREGLGIAVIPPIVAADEIRSGDLVEYGHLAGVRETFLAVSKATRFPHPLVAMLTTPER